MPSTSPVQDVKATAVLEARQILSEFNGSARLAADAEASREALTAAAEAHRQALAALDGASLWSTPPGVAQAVRHPLPKVKPAEWERLTADETAARQALDAARITHRNAAKRRDQAPLAIVDPAQHAAATAALREHETALIDALAEAARHAEIISTLALSGLGWGPISADSRLIGVPYFDAIAESISSGINAAEALYLRARAGQAGGPSPEQQAQATLYAHQPATESRYDAAERAKRAAGPAPRPRPLPDVDELNARVQAKIAKRQPAAN